MKKIYLFPLIIAIFCVSVKVNSQSEVRTINWDNVDREYIEYVPSSYSSENPAPVVFCLHGLGDNMTNFSNLGFHQIANQHGWIVITPQALMANITGLGNVGEAWNSGAGAEDLPFLGDVVLNEDVDDAGFLIAVLDSLENHYNIDNDSVFFMGFSMGGFMSNRMAIEHGDRINAVASVSGTIGKFLEAEAQYNLNTLHIHGTEDTQIGYENAEFDTGGMGVYSVGTGAEETVEYWRSFNNCDSEAIVTYFPDIMDDGLTFERYLYQNGNEDSYTGFIKVIGGDHHWYYTPQNDIDYTTEIWRFFTNQMTFPEPTDILNTNKNENVINVYPNPASSYLNIELPYLPKESYRILVIDAVGKKHINTISENCSHIVNIENLKSGLYFIRIIENNNVYEESIVITR